MDERNTSIITFKHLHFITINDLKNMQYSSSDNVEDLLIKKIFLDCKVSYQILILIHD